MRYLFLFIFLLFSFQQKNLASDIFNEFLIAQSHMPDSRFKETVILMLSHDNEGAAGLVINKPVKKMTIDKLFEESNIVPPKKILKKEITLYWGGPVKPEHIFFIHSSDYKSEDYILVNKDYTVTRAPKILFDIINNIGPKEYIILSGIAIWSPGQLDLEIKKGDWHQKFNSYVPLFDNGNEMWSRLIDFQEI